MRASRQYITQPGGLREPPSGVGVYQNDYYSGGVAEVWRILQHYQGRRDDDGRRASTCLHKTGGPISGGSCSCGRFDPMARVTVK